MRRTGSCNRRRCGSVEQEEYAIAVQKGDKDLLEKVNKVLGELKDSGKIEEFGATYSE